MTKPARPLRVLVVDDSVVARKYLLNVLDSIAGIETVGSAHDGPAARRLIGERQPDILTLDIDMPHTNGLSFLESLMRWHPMPVIVISSMVGGSTHTAECAMSVGAIAAIAKPGPGSAAQNIFRQELAKALTQAKDRVHSKAQGLHLRG